MYRNVNNRIAVFWVIFGLLFSGLSSAAPVSAATRESVRGKHAMVASQHVLASRIGVDVMKRGGNAVDAAIAVGLALAVVYPEAGNIGGGGFMLIRMSDGRSHAIDYREVAPKAASRGMYLSTAGNDGNGRVSSTTGYMASGVPGTLSGFDLAFTKYGSGKLKWQDLVRPARLIAENGYRLTFRLAEQLRSKKETLSRFEDSKRIFLNSGKYYREDDLFKQPELAQTLGRIEKEGAGEFYKGKTARLIARDMHDNGGSITLEDLRAYHAVERTPLLGTYRGSQLISMPPPSSGGIVMTEVLNILEGYDITKMQNNSAAKYHVLAEAMRRAFADRAEFLGDPDFSDIPVNNLIDKGYAENRRSTIRTDRASDSAETGHGEITGYESQDTTAFTVVDAAGTVVTNTYTLNDLYGSGVTAKGTGVLLNDEMDDFAARPGEPNMFGLIQGEKNSVQPGKRPLSSMSPTIVLRKDGSFWFAVGARGGPRIISAVTQIIINMIDHDMDIQAAIDSPRIHHQWLPDELLFEPYGMSPDSISILKSFGHKITPQPTYLASATGVMVGTDGVRFGAIDSRSDGEAVGY